MHIMLVNHDKYIVKSKYEATNVFFKIFHFIIKMLRDLFRRLRRNEPTQILVLRRFIIIISLELFIILCVGVYEELPSIKTTLKPVDNLPVPGKNNLFFFQVKKN